MTGRPDFPYWLSFYPKRMSLALWKQILVGSLCDTLCFLCLSRLGLAGQVSFYLVYPSKGQTRGGQAGRLGMVLGLPSTPSSRGTWKGLGLSKVLGPTGTTRAVGSNKLLGRSYRGKKNRN